MLSDFLGRTDIYLEVIFFLKYDKEIKFIVEIFQHLKTWGKQANQRTWFLSVWTDHWTTANNSMNRTNQHKTITKLYSKVTVLLWQAGRHDSFNTVNSANEPDEPLLSSERTKINKENSDWTNGEPVRNSENQRNAGSLLNPMLENDTNALDESAGIRKFVIGIMFWQK